MGPSSYSFNNVQLSVTRMLVYITNFSLPSYCYQTYMQNGQVELQVTQSLGKF